MPRIRGSVCSAVTALSNCRPRTFRQWIWFSLVTLFGAAATLNAVVNPIYIGQLFGS